MTEPVVKLTWQEAKALPDVSDLPWGRRPARYRVQREVAGAWGWYMAEQEMYPCPQHGHAMVETKYYRIVIRLEVQ